MITGRRDTQRSAVITAGSWSTRCSGHILWAGEIAGEAELPRSLAAIAR